MIIVPLPQSHFDTMPSHHRRLPSAPALLHVKPTHTPGILSISKPQRAHNHQQAHVTHQKQPRSSKVKLALLQHRSPHMSRAQPSNADSKLQSGDSPVDSESPVVTVQNPEKPARGRQQAKQGRDKASNRSPYGRRNARHPSSPTTSSQAEVATPSSNQRKPKTSKQLNNNNSTIDPFIDSDSDRSVPAEGTTFKVAPPPPVRPTPTLTSHPSGPLASRRKGRRIQAPPSPTPSPGVVHTPTPVVTRPPHPSAPVPIPSSSDNDAAILPSARPSMQLSRSDPVLSSMPVRPKFSRTTTAIWDEFPICDDTADSDDEEVDQDGDIPLPSLSFVSRDNPVKEAAALKVQFGHTFDDGPRTAPLSSSGWYATLPHPPTTPMRRHVRMSSEGVFTMSLDDGSTTATDPTEQLKAFLNLSVGRRNQHGGVGAMRARMMHGAKVKALDDSATKPSFFANSMFQNSPSPDELPPPSFGTAA